MIPGLVRRAVNGAWIAACSREHARFSRAVYDVEQTQRRLLLAVLKANKDTILGKQFGFSEILTVRDYQSTMPLQDYTALAPYIERICRGEPNVLTADQITLLQPTSGTTSGTKLIPWNAAVSREFRRGIDPWLFSLYRRKPTMLRGTAYWSISPSSAPPPINSRIPIGFAHDADYLGYFGKKAFSLVSTVPEGVAQAADILEFRTKTLIALLADENLSLISVWSPTFLTALLTDFLARADEILQSMRESRSGKLQRRARIVEDLASRNPEGGLFERVWPRLKVVSCWTHGPSSLYAQNLSRFFPNVEIQGKGLVATEAFVSLPIDAEADPVLAVTSHFFEFKVPGEDKMLLSHELETGREYEVIVTTSGGLYRYPLRDRVRVTGFFGQTPRLRFVGRVGVVSDLFGEKLEAAFVQAILCRVFGIHSLSPTFAMLSPTHNKNGVPGYTLFLEVQNLSDPEGLIERIEEGLKENFHYANCRRLGQLSAARLFLIRSNSIPAESVFLQEMTGRRIKAGDVKMTPLDCHFGWELRFRGTFNEPRRESEKALAQ